MKAAGLYSSRTPTKKNDTKIPFIEEGLHGTTCFEKVNRLFTIKGYF